VPDHEMGNSNGHTGNYNLVARLLFFTALGSFLLNLVLQFIQFSKNTSSINEEEDEIA
jgi:hypothetical protein